MEIWEGKRKKHILRAAAILSAVAALCVFGAWGEGRRGGYVSGKERENRLYPSEAEAVQMAGTLPLTCTPVSERYQKEEGERGFSEELLTDLQECVREGGMSAAIEAYRDDTLLIDVDTLLSLCPDYESLIAEQAEKQKVGLSGKDILDDIVSIYRLEFDGDTLLVEYRDLGYPWFVLKKTEDGYLAGNVNITNPMVDSWARYGSAMFAEGDGYCLLERMVKDEEELLSLSYFTLPKDWQETIGESRGVFKREFRFIRVRAVNAEPVFFYLNGKIDLTGEVRSYVEENAMIFADRLAEDDVIWGDEMPAVMAEEKAEITWETGECREISAYSWRDYVIQADYDNAGEEKLFWRGTGHYALVQAEDGGYQAESVSLYGADMPAERMWFVAFSGKTVTFEIVEPYGTEYPLLAAYLMEGNKKTPLLTCQLVYGKTVEIDDNEYADSNSFQVRQVMPLFTDLEKETGEQTAFNRKLTAWIREADSGIIIEPLQAETPFSEEFLEFIREGAAWCFSGKLFSAYAAPYEVQSEKDLEKFEEEFKEKCEAYDVHMFWYDVVYREEASDGTISYLVRDYWESEYGVNTLHWYRDNGEGFEEEPVTDLSGDYGSYCGVLSYDGQIYCVITNIDLYGAMWRMDLLPLGDDGVWEHYCISFSYAEKTYEILSFAENEVLNSYVEEEAEAIYAAAAESLYWGGASYSGSGEWGEIPQEIWRIIKNREFSYSQHWYMDSFNSKHNGYVPVDVDNDGEPEYASVYLVTGKKRATGLEYTIYGWRDGIFTELTMDGEGLLHCYTDEDGGYGINGELDQMWFEEIDGVTYLFTVEKLTLLDGFLMRARVIQDGKVQDAGAWLFRHTGVMLQDIQEMGEYDSWLSA